MNKEFFENDTMHLKKAQVYLQKYVRELQLHFDLSDSNLKKIIAQTHNGIKSKNPIQNLIDMIR
ncbi:hypothetical protein tpqmel_0217 [Candidatus Gastranaerophilus sp. (ex Termes propinquus)]|nr:hypothetical protein tpqmel_0217 [Candidatus Gastranaerophilus sp. (ex Termes propinquus)]